MKVGTPYLVRKWVVVDGSGQVSQGRMSVKWPEEANSDCREAMVVRVRASEGERPSEGEHEHDHEREKQLPSVPSHRTAPAASVMKGVHRAATCDDGEVAEQQP